MTHLSVEEATATLRRWREREDIFLVLMGFCIGFIFGQGWGNEPDWQVVLAITLIAFWFTSFAQRARATQKLELSIEERDQYRAQRRQELHDQEVFDLQELIAELRQDLAERAPHVH